MSETKITVEDQSNDMVLASIKLKDNITEVPNKKKFEPILREYSGQTIKIQEIREGSINILVKGSLEDIQKIISLIKSKEITELGGFPIEKIEINKWDLIREIRNQSIKKRDLIGVDLSDTNLRGLDLNDADLREVNLIHADLSGADLSGADLSGADLRNADLSAADLSAADLSAADLRGAKINENTQFDLKWGKLWEIVNQGASTVDLRFADLRFADLRFADLSAADLSAADLRNADLRNADLSAADLSAADLRFADLRFADLSAADLSAADLRFARVKKARFAYNKGISESLRLNLIKQGAIFKDLPPGDRSKVLTRA